MRQLSEPPASTDKPPIKLSDSRSPSPEPSSLHIVLSIETADSSEDNMPSPPGSKRPSNSPSSRQGGSNSPQSQSPTNRNTGQPTRSLTEILTDRSDSLALSLFSGLVDASNGISSDQKRDLKWIKVEPGEKPKSPTRKWKKYSGGAESSSPFCGGRLYLWWMFWKCNMVVHRAKCKIIGLKLQFEVARQSLD